MTRTDEDCDDEPVPRRPVLEQDPPAAKCWRELSEDDLDAIDEMRRDDDVRSRRERSCARRGRWSDMREPEPDRSRQHWG